MLLTQSPPFGNPGCMNAQARHSTEQTHSEDGSRPGFPAWAPLGDPVRVEFPDFRDALAALPPGRLSLDDARLPQFCIYEDPRVVAYYAPFDYVNTRARLAESVNLFEAPSRGSY
jgi:hypothetical protein